MLTHSKRNCIALWEQHVKFVFTLIVMSDYVPTRQKHVVNVHIMRWLIQTRNAIIIKEIINTQTTMLLLLLIMVMIIYKIQLYSSLHRLYMAVTCSFSAQSVQVVCLLIVKALFAFSLEFIRLWRLTPTLVPFCESYRCVLFCLEKSWVCFLLLALMHMHRNVQFFNSSAGLPALLRLYKGQVHINMQK